MSLAVILRSTVAFDEPRLDAQGAPYVAPLIGQPVSPAAYNSVPRPVAQDGAHYLVRPISNIAAYVVLGSSMLLTISSPYLDCERLLPLWRKRRRAAALQ